LIDKNYLILFNKYTDTKTITPPDIIKYVGTFLNKKKVEIKPNIGKRE